MSKSIKVAIGINETLLNAALEEFFDCPELKSFYHRTGIHSTLIRIGGGNVVMFGSFTEDEELAEKIDRELQLAQDLYIHLNNFLPGRYTYGIRVDLPQNVNAHSRMPLRYFLGCHEDFDFSQVVFITPNPVIEPNKPKPLGF